jgi:N-acetylglutamate synthase-like GNAT family acetyltransferase
MIRRAALSDLNQLATLAEDYCRRRKEVASRARILATLSEQITDLPFFVVERAGKVLGGLSLHIIDHPFSGKPIAGKALWYTSEAGRGYGLSLLRHAEKYARSLGAREMWVGVEDERASTLLQARGYGLAERKYRKALS